MLRAGSIGRDRRRDQLDSVITIDRNAHATSIHRFAVGEMVDFLPGPGDADAPRGKYKIQRLRPSKTPDPQYRLKQAVDGHERAVSESQIAARNYRFG
jgi:hypothetical protein